MQSAVYFFGSAAAAIVAAAGLLRDSRTGGLDSPAPWLMALPITYLVAGRLWRGHSPERPLTWVAQAATVVILIGVLAASFEVGGIETALSPRTGEPANLLYGLVFAEVAAFYVLATIFGGPGINLALCRHGRLRRPLGASRIRRGPGRVSHDDLCGARGGGPGRFPGYWGSSRSLSTDTRIRIPRPFEARD